MDICPKNKGIHCPLFEDEKCNKPEEECILNKIDESIRSNRADITEIRKKFDTLLKASQKVFRQFGITLEV